MSLANLARRFRKSSKRTDAQDKSTEHTDDSTDISISPSPSNPSRGGSVPPQESTAKSDNTTAMPKSDNIPAMPMPTPNLSVQMPVPDLPSPIMSMPTPQSPYPNTETTETLALTVVSQNPPRPMDSALEQLAPLQARLDVGPALNKTERALTSTGDKVDGLTAQANRVMSAIGVPQVAMNSLEQSDIAKKIERGIQRFADDIPWLMKGLDELARIHPVVTVAVLAFKVVYTLESTRQDNDRRVMTLYVEMKDMMLVMVQLRSIENRTHVGLDGRILKDRLEELAEKTARDIRECANFCDTFLKKKMVVKVLKSQVWAMKLAEFVQVFTARKDEFQLALAMHTANSISDVKKQNAEIQAKLDVVIALFSRYVSADERRLATEVESKGGITKCRQDDDVLKSLLALEMRAGPAGNAKDAEKQAAGPRGLKTASKKTMTFDELKLELREDIDDALEKNLQVFVGKFELQFSMLQDALERYIHAENDRVIGAVTEVIKYGPHMKIKDLELRKIWEEMNWRGNVKARLFVTTLQDHYREHFDDQVERPKDPEAEGGAVNDEWALEYLNMAWLDPIMEAFDDDKSGYVTIAEVNRLMDLRPLSLKWSVPHWLAYWAIGWKVAAYQYIAKFKQLRARVRDAIPTVLAQNRNPIDEYLLAWAWISMLSMAIELPSQYTVEALSNRFQEYVDIEEDRIRKNLEKIKYRIDASDTLALVTGPGQLEKFVFPLIYLLLENDLRKIIAAQSVVLKPDEFTRSHEAISEVITAMARRHDHMFGLFKQQKLEPKDEIKRHAAGLYTYMGSDYDFWKPEMESHEFFSNDLPEDTPPLPEITPDLTVLDIERDSPLNYSLYDAVDEENEADLLAPDLVKPLLGRWNGFTWDDDWYPSRTMLSYLFHYRSGEGPDNFCASGVEVDGDPYEISGQCVEKDDGSVSVTWATTYPGDYIIYHTGEFVDEYTITGTRITNDVDSPTKRSFILKKIPATAMMFRPGPEQLSVPANRYRLLWNFALSSTLYDVQRKRWSWAYFAARRDARKAYVDIYTRVDGPPYPDYYAKMARAEQNCVAQDACFYDSIAVNRLKTKPIHQGLDSCDNMDDTHCIRGARWICLTCYPQPEYYTGQVTFCDELACYSQFIRKDEERNFHCHHTPLHDFVKIRSILHRLQWPHLRRWARDTLEAIRAPHCCLPDPPMASETSSVVYSHDGDANLPAEPGTDDASGMPEDPSDPASGGGDVVNTVDSEEAGETVKDDLDHRTPDAPTSQAVEDPDRTQSSNADSGVDASDHSTNESQKPEDVPLPADAGKDDALPDEPSVNGDAHDVLEHPVEDVGNIQDPPHPPVLSTDVEHPTPSSDTDAEENDSVKSHPGAGGYGDEEAADKSAEGSYHGTPLTDVERQLYALKPKTGDDQVHDNVSEAGTAEADQLPVTAPSCCKICEEQVYMGQCWYCLECEAYICRECEAGTLIACWSCKKPFPQPEWYYREIDEHLCAMCCARGKKGPDPDNWATRRHVYTHPLVQVKHAVFDSLEEADEGSEELKTERRLASLENRITAMDTRLEELQSQFSQLEPRLQEQFSQLESRLQEKISELLASQLLQLQTSNLKGHDTV